MGLLFTSARQALSHQPTLHPHLPDLNTRVRILFGIRGRVSSHSAEGVERPMLRATTASRS
jgi:hypothetical protein